MSMRMGILESQSMSARASEDSAILDFIKTKQALVEDVISVEEVASACVYLLTDASHAITGHTVRCRRRLERSLAYTFPRIISPVNRIMLCSA